MQGHLCSEFFSSRKERLRRSDRLYRNNATMVSTIREFDSSTDLGEECVIFSTAYIEARLQRRTTLPHNDRAARDCLTGKPFHAKTLCIGIAPVGRTSATFFVCHLCLSLSLRGGATRNVRSV